MHMSIFQTRYCPKHAIWSQRRNVWSSVENQSLLNSHNVAHALYWMIVQSELCNICFRDDPHLCTDSTSIVWCIIVYEGAIHCIQSWVSLCHIKRNKSEELSSHEDNIPIVWIPISVLHAYFTNIQLPDLQFPLDRKIISWWKCKVDVFCFLKNDKDSVRGNSLSVEA